MLWPNCTLLHANSGGPGLTKVSGLWLGYIAGRKAWERMLFDVVVG